MTAAEKKAFALVIEFFGGDATKARIWFSTPNPLLGNVAPADMILMGRAKKLLKFIEARLAENRR